MKEVSSWRPGILSPRQLKYLQDKGLLRDCDDPDECAIDLHLSRQGWRMKGSIKHIAGEQFATLSTRKEFVEGPLDLSHPELLEANHTYVVQLRESLSLSGSNGCLWGQATGKSSVGRLDVLTRLMVDNCETYDTLPPDRSGPLYVEITPITFPIIVNEGTSLNQLRLFRGEPQLSLLSIDEIRLYGAVLNWEKEVDNLVGLSLNLDSTRICDSDVIAYTTLKPVFSDGEAVDLSGAGKEQEIDPRKYWMLVPAEPQRYIRIEAGRFYILRSKERFRLPEDLGVYCQAITENLGEIRIHYAGFVHPGFGYSRDDGAEGTPLIFEVRGHSIDAFLRHGELMAKLLFYRTSEKVEIRSSPYDSQELKLSKYFAEWTQ